MGPTAGHLLLTTIAALSLATACLATSYDFYVNFGDTGDCLTDTSKCGSLGAALSGGSCPYGDGDTVRVHVYSALGTAAPTPRSSCARRSSSWRSWERMAVRTF